jgi:acetylglutamate kinase
MTRVIKIGGRPQMDPRLPAAMAAGWDANRKSAVLVHGGGDEVSALQKVMGAEARFVDGRRVTSAQDVDIVRMALSGLANKRLVSALQSAGVPAVGLSGEDGSLITASPVDPERLGYVGAPARINVPLLWTLMDAGYLPVVSPVSRNEHGSMGSALNVNGDDAAAAIAVAASADELLLISDVEGVMRDGVVLPRLDASQAQALLDDGTAQGGMRAKLQAALSALDGGVDQVRISDIAAIADGARGTVVTRTSAGGGT